MGKATLILGVAVFILLLLFVMQLTKARTAESELNDARELGSATRALLKASSIRCSARPTEYLKLAECIKPHLTKNDFNDREFKNFNKRDNETGVFIIENNGKKTYDGTAFILLKNGIEAHRGCHIEGDISPEYTCRFDINETCEKGDVLEVVYEITSNTPAEEAEGIEPETPETVRLVTHTC